MSLLRRILDQPLPQPSELLPNSKNLAMKRMLGLTGSAKRDRDVLSDTLPELPEELPSASR